VAGQRVNRQKLLTGSEIEARRGRHRRPPAEIDFTEGTNGDYRSSSTALYGDRPAEPRQATRSTKLRTSLSVAATRKRLFGGSKALAAVWGDDEIGLGPRTVKRPRTPKGGDNIVTSLHDYPVHVADARDVAQQLVFGFEEALVEEVVDLNARNGQANSSSS
jgi:hypothetical protein